MEAADESKQQGGKPVSVAELIERTRQAARAGKTSRRRRAVESRRGQDHHHARAADADGGICRADPAGPGKLSDLEAKALVLEDATGRRAVLVTMDLVGIGRQLSIDVCERIEKQYGIARPAVALGSRTIIAAR